jgi:hypothetical protein
MQCHKTHVLWDLRVSTLKCSLIIGHVLMYDFLLKTTHEIKPWNRHTLSGTLYGSLPAVCRMWNKLCQCYVDCEDAHGNSSDVEGSFQLLMRFNFLITAKFSKLWQNGSVNYKGCLVSLTATQKWSHAFDRSTNGSEELNLAMYKVFPSCNPTVCLLLRHYCRKQYTSTIICFRNAVVGLLLIGWDISVVNGREGTHPSLVTQAVHRFVYRQKTVRSEENA